MIDHNRIISEVSDFFNISVQLIKSPSRKQEIVHARHVAMYLVRKNLNYSYPYIAKLFERNDHTTVIHAEKSVENSINKSDYFSEKIKHLNDLILSNSQKTEDHTEINTNFNYNEETHIFDKKIENEGYLSVRTLNCFKSENIIYFRDLVEKKPPDLMRIRNFGLNSLYEIQELLNTKNLKLGMRIDGNFEDSSSDNASEEDDIDDDKIYLFNDYIKEISDSEFKTLNLNVATLGFSVRTQNCLKNINVFKIVDLIQQNEKELLKGPNLGRKSLVEIQQYLSKENLNLNTKVINWHNDNINQYEERTVIKKDFSLITIKDEINKFFEVLSERELDVIKKRYGIGYSQYLTLEEIGQEQDITRERVRQIESKAIRKIKTQFALELEELIYEKKDYLWDILSDKKIFIVAPTNYKNIKGYDALLIDLIFSKIDKFLNNFFFSVAGYGWVKENLSVDSIVETIKLLTNLENKYSNIKNKYYPIFPQTLSRFINNYSLDNRILEIASELSGAFFMYKKMIHFKPISIRKVRTIRIFEILYNNQQIQILSSFNIYQKYKQDYNDDNCSLRDITFILDEFSNIFLNLYHNIYTVITDHNDYDHYQKIQDFSQKSITLYNVGEPKEYDSLRNITIDYVKSSGCVFTKEVYDFLYNKVENPSSSGYVLKNSEFVLLAPGLFGLNENINDTVNDPKTINKLLKVDNCKHYILAKYAGEKNIYPMWNDKMELAWLKWSSTQAPLPIYESLLYVSNPSKWSSSNQEIESWMDLKKRFSKFHFKIGIKKSMANYVTPLENIFRLLMYVKMNKSCNFIAVNRIAKPLLFDDWKSSVILAILIKLKIINPADHWMDNHFITEDSSHVDYLINLFLNNFIYNKDTSWTGSFGQELINLITNSAVMSWVDENEFNLFLNILARTKN